MSTSVNTGATMGISASLPTSFDDDPITGYDSVSFTDIGEIVDIGELAKTWSMVTHQPVTRQHHDKLKDTYDIPDVPLTLGRDSTDAGQVLLQTALNDPTLYSFKITLPSGDTAAFLAKVTKAGLGSIATGSVSTTTVTLAVEPETLFEA